MCAQFIPCPLFPRHLYFVEDNAIDRCNLDGSNRQSILEIEDSVEINGLAIDVANNIIYWTQTTWTLTSVLRSYDMDLFDESVVTVMFVSIGWRFVCVLIWGV